MYRVKPAEYGPPAVDPSTQSPGAELSMVKTQVVSPGQRSVYTLTMSVWSQTHEAVGAGVVVGTDDGAAVEGAGAEFSLQICFAKSTLRD